MRPLDLREVAQPPQERFATRGVPRARVATSSAASASMPDLEEARRSARDVHEVGRVVGLEPLEEAEARAERRREQAFARRRADQRERLDLQAHGPRARTLVDHDVDHEVLHRGVEVLLDRGRQAVDLVDEEDVAALELVSSPARSAARSRAGPDVL